MSEREKAELFRGALPARSPELVEKHRGRALAAMASHICSTELTNGFCGPEYADGKMSGPVVCRGHGLGDRNCVTRAAYLMQSIENVGCTVVWAFDQEMRGE